jgi:TP901 family phage tail tape measure protein
MADNNLILDFVAGIRLGTDGIVNQKEVVASITKDIEKSLNSIKIDAGQITISPDIKLNKTTLAAQKKNIETTLDGLSRAIDAKKRGQKIGSELFDGMFLDSIGRNKAGAAQARQALAKVFEPMSLARLTGLQDAKLAQSKLNESMAQYNALGKKTQKLYNSFQKGGIIPAKDLAQMRQATEAVGRVLDARARLVKAAAGGKLVKEPAFETVDAVEAGQKIAKRVKIRDDLAQTPALDTKGAAAVVGGRAQLKAVQDALSKEDTAVRRARVNEENRAREENLKRDLEAANAVAEAREDERQKQRKADADADKARKRRHAEDLKAADERSQQRAKDLALEKQAQFGRRRAERAADPAVAARRQATQGLRQGFGGASDADLSLNKTIFAGQIKQLDLMKKGVSGLSDLEEKRLRLLQRAQEELGKEQRRRKSLASDITAANRVAEADRQREAAAAAKAVAARKAENAAILEQKAKTRQTIVQAGPEGKGGGYQTKGEIQDAQRLLAAEQARLRNMGTMSASRRRRVAEIERINVGLAGQLQTLKRIQTEQAKIASGGGGGRGGGTGVGDNFDDMSKKAGNLRDRLGETGLLLRQFLRYALGYGALYKALAAVTALTKGVVQLDKELKSIEAISQATEEQMLSIEAAIKGVAVTTKFSVQEIAKAARVLAQAGVEPEQINKVLSSVAQFAAGTETALDVAADVASTMRNVFKELEDIQIADKLTKAINISKLTGNDLKVILSISAQIGKSFQLTSDQYLAAVTTLRNAGLKASTVATGLRQGLLEIFSPDSKSLKALKDRYAQIGEALNDSDIKKRFAGFQAASNPLLAALKELNRLGFTGEGKQTFARAFDIRAENAISALIDNIDKLEESEARISLGGAAAEASATQMESLANTLDNLGAAMTVLAADITEGPIAALQELAKGATDAVNALDKLDIDLKAKGGDGIGGILTTAASGGVAGASLAGGGVLRRIVGGAAGAAAGAYGGQQTLDQAATGEITPAAAEKTLDIVSALLNVISILSLSKGFASLKQLKATVGPSGKFGQASLKVGEISGVIISLGAIFGGVFGTLLKGLKGLGTVALTFARANPIGIVLTAAYAAYEAWQAFGDSAETQADEFARLEQQSKAQKQRNVRNRQALEKTREGFAEYQFTDREQGVEARANTSADYIETAATRLERGRAELRKQFFSGVEDLDALATNFETLASGPAAEADSPARKVALQALSKASGVDLTNLSAERDRLLSSLVSGISEPIRQITSIVSDLSVKYERLKSQDFGALPVFDQTFITEYEAIQSKNPRLYAAMRGDKKALAEIGGVDGLLSNIETMYTAISKVSQDLLPAQLEAEVEGLTAEFSTEVDKIVKGVASGELTLVQAESKLLAELDKLSKTGETSFDALEAAAATIEQKFAELEDQANTARETLIQIGSTPRREPQFVSGRYGPGAAPQDTTGRDAASAGLAITNAEAGKQVTGLADRLQKDVQDKLIQQGEKANVEAEKSATALFEGLKDNAKALENDEVFKELLRTLGTEASNLFNAAAANDREDFDKFARAISKELTKTTRVTVRPLTVKAAKLQAGATKAEGRRATVAAEQRKITEYQKYAPDIAAGQKIAELDTQIARLTKIKSPDLFAPDSPIHKKANLQAAEITKELGQLGEDIKKAADKDSLQGYQKQQTLLKKQSELHIKRNKILEAANKSIEDARFAYEKQSLQAQKEVATAEKRLVDQQLTNLVISGNADDLRKLQDERVRINEALLATDEKLLRHSGKSEKLIQLKVKADTEALQQAEARKRAEEVIAVTQENLRNVGTTATSGSVVEDAARSARGLEFSDAEKLSSYADSATKIYKEIAMLQAQLGDPTVSQAPVIKELEKLNIELATLEGQFDRIDTNGFEQAFRAFDPKLIATDLQNLESAFQNLGDSIRGNIVGAIDEIGPSLFDAVVDGGDALDVLQSIAYDMFRNIGREAAGSLVNSLSQELLAQFDSSDTKALFGSIFGIGGGDIAGAAASAAENQPGDAGAFTSALTAGAATNAAVANVTGQIVNVTGSVAGADVTQSLLGKISETNEVQVDLGQETIQKSEGWFSGLGSLFTNGLNSLGGFFSSLFSGGGGGGGGFLQSAIGFISNLFTAADGVADIGTKQGAVTSSGVITGPGTGVSDSIAAALFEGNRVTPIAVGAGESILTAKATRMIGVDQISRWNKGRIKGFAQGMVPAAKTPGSSAAAAAAAPQVNASTRIVNVLDPDLMQDYLSSSTGEKVVLNIIQRNPTAVNQYLR